MIFIDAEKFRLRAGPTYKEESMSSFSPWDLYGIDAPWGERPSLFQHIQAHIRPGKAGLTQGGDKLPDVQSMKGNSGLVWNLGGRNATVGHYTRVAGDADQVADEVLRALHSLTEEATAGRVATLYALLAEQKAQDYYLSLLNSISQDPDLDWSRIYSVAIWLAERAPDREPVKVAIAILGLYQGREERVSTIRTLGRHEEFASYAATALDGEKNVEKNLWERAQHVDGRHRIQLVDKLAGTRNERIQAWMLREGYEKDAWEHLAHEYSTPYTCATTGDLLGALHSSVPDEALLAGAADILQALIDGRWGPAEGIYEYVDAAPTTELWLGHLQKRNCGVRQLAVADRIRQFLTDDLPKDLDGALESEEQDLEKNTVFDWMERRDDLLQQVYAILSHPGWEDEIRKSLASPDYPTFRAAVQSARALDVEGRDICFERLRQREVNWFECWNLVLDTDDSERFDSVVALAQERLLFDEEILTHSADDATPALRSASSLRSVLQKHHVLPGKGWWLVRGGMLSPNSSTRKLAVRVLASWDRWEWPGSAESLLRKVLDLEQNEEIRTLIRTLLEHQPCD